MADEISLTEARQTKVYRTSLSDIAMKHVTVIGGGLAGVEAAWQAARLGARVRLFEMRPVRQTPAHRTDKLAEIVCSNSLKSDEPGTASFLLKEELRRGSSLVMDVAAATRVPAGAALAVDREKFAELITQRIEGEPRIELIRDEVTTTNESDISIIATGPLTSEALTLEVMLPKLFLKDLTKVFESLCVHAITIERP